MERKNLHAGAHETSPLVRWQVRLAAAVGQQRRMSRDAAALFTEGAPAEVVLPDCTALEPGALAAALQDCATPRCDYFLPLTLLPCWRLGALSVPTSGVLTPRCLKQTSTAVRIHRQLAHRQCKV